MAKAPKVPMAPKDVDELLTIVNEIALEGAKLTRATHEEDWQGTVDALAELHVKHTAAAGWTLAYHERVFAWADATGLKLNLPYPGKETK